jgi:hypothetical protein
MKIGTEWRLGYLAVVLNILSCFLCLITLLTGFEGKEVGMSVVWFFSGVYLVTLTALFLFWVDKLNYIRGLTVSKERIKQYRLRQKELGRLKRELYLTDSELEQLKVRLAELRKST